MGATKGRRKGQARVFLLFLLGVTSLAVAATRSCSPLLPVTCPHTSVSPPLLVCASSSRGRCAPGRCSSPGCHHLCLACHSSITFVAASLCLFPAERLVWAVFLMEPTWSRGRAFESRSFSKAQALSRSTFDASASSMRRGFACISEEKRSVDVQDSYGRDQC